MNVHLELLHGAENAFGLLDDRAVPQPRLLEAEYVEIARALSDTDGLLVLLRPSTPEATVRMRMFNPDGGEAEMCGNGIRCVARYLAERGEGESCIVQTAAGPIAAHVLARNPYTVETAIGVPQVGAERELEAAGKRWHYVPVSVGNPHAVVFVDDVGAVDLSRFGPAISTHADFPAGANVHFVAVEGVSSLNAIHWERGAGETRACGTGIVAGAAAAMRYRGVTSPVAVRVPGGVLSVTWDGKGVALLTGPVEHTGARELALR